MALFPKLKVQRFNFVQYLGDVSDDIVLHMVDFAPNLINLISIVNYGLAPTKVFFNTINI